MISAHDNIEIAQERAEQYADIIAKVDEVRNLAGKKWAELDDKPRDDTQRWAADQIEQILSELDHIRYKIIWGA